MDLLSLPTEVFEAILCAAIEARGIKRGLRLRLVNRLFAGAVKHCLYTFKLLDDYCDEYNPYDSDYRILPAALREYLAYRVVHEPAKGNPLLACIRRAVEDVCSVDYTHPSTGVVRVGHLFSSWHEYNPPNGSTRSQRWRDIFHRTTMPSEDEYQQLRFAVAIGTNTLPVVQQCVAKDEYFWAKIKELDSENPIIGHYCMVVAEHCNTQVIGYLLTVGVPVVNKDLRSRLFCIAVEYGRADIFKFLYDFKREEAPWDFTLATYEGYLVQYGPKTPSLEVRKFFQELRRLDCNLDVDWNLVSELHVCAEAGRLETAKYNLACALWSYRRDGSRRSLEIKEDQLNSALREAAKWNHSAVVELLLQHDASANAAIGKAVSYGRTAIVQILLRAGAAPNGQLSTAASRGYWDTVRILLDAGVDADESAGQESPLASAIEREHPAMFNFLLERGANLHEEETAKECVRRAKKDGLESMLQLLEVNGVNVEEVEGRSDDPGKIA